LTVEFSQEELFDAMDRLIGRLLDRVGITTPPVDALHIAEEHLGIPVEVVDPAEEDELPRRRRPRPHTAGIVLTPGMTPDQEQKAAAAGVAQALLPDLLRRLSIAPETATPALTAHLRGQLAARLLIPTRMLRGAANRCKYDVLALHALFHTATPEAVALRLLDLEEPCVITIVDDGVVTLRRGNRTRETKKLTAAEQECVERILALDLPHRARIGSWTASGWPVPGRAFRRILVRAVPDDV
jgi:predicted transcriptional regulator